MSVLCDLLTSSEIGSCGLGELGLHLGQKTWADGAQEFHPSALQSSNPKSQSLGEFLKFSSLSCQCGSSHESTADLSLPDANAQIILCLLLKTHYQILKKHKFSDTFLNLLW